MVKLKVVFKAWLLLLIKYEHEIEFIKVIRTDDGWVSQARPVTDCLLSQAWE